VGPRDIGRSRIPGCCDGGLHGNRIRASPVPLENSAREPADLVLLSWPGTHPTVDELRAEARRSNLRLVRRFGGETAVADVYAVP
jgi:hypothetical protein